MKPECDYTAYTVNEEIGENCIIYAVPGFLQGNENVSGEFYLDREPGGLNLAGKIPILILNQDVCHISNLIIILSGIKVWIGKQ